MQELLDDLDVIERFQMPEKEGFYGEITDQQRGLYTAFGVTPSA
jgi:hypothetical protein